MKVNPCFNQQPQARAAHQGKERIHLQRGAPLAGAGTTRMPTAGDGRQYQSVCAVLKRLAALDALSEQLGVSRETAKKYLAMAKRVGASRS